MTCWPWAGLFVCEAHSDRGTAGIAEGRTASMQTPNLGSQTWVRPRDAMRGRAVVGREHRAGCRAARAAGSQDPRYPQCCAAGGAEPRRWWPQGWEIGAQA